MCGHIVNMKGEGDGDNDIMVQQSLCGDTRGRARNGEINCITNWPQCRFIIGHIT